MLKRSGKIAKWGNSLGVRIPQEIAAQLELREASEVSVEVKNDALIIRPLPQKRKKWTEAELLKGVTPALVGGEIRWGKPIGREII